MAENTDTAAAPPPGLRRGIARWALALVVAVALIAPGLVLPEPVGAAAVVAGDVADAADAAIAWLDAEVAANGGTVPGFSPGSTDWGLTADVALARIATGRAGDAATEALATRLLGALSEYTTWDSVGPDYTGVRVSGALAKTLLVASSAGLDTSAVSGIDLEGELRSLMWTTGDSAGRFSDRNPHAADKSNGFDQAYAMLALSLGGVGVPDASVAFLIAQQCPGGGFRLVYGPTVGCVDDSETDPDATALAVQALLVAPRTPAVEQSLADALARLLGSQSADGSFAGAPPADVLNANSTGLIGQTLRAAGQTSAADAAASWITGQVQLGDSAAGTPAAGDTGAIAYQPERRGVALASGIAAQARDQWRRASSQGVLALGAGPFVSISDEAPVEPSPVTSTTTTTAAPLGPLPEDAAPSTSVAAPSAPVAGAPAPPAAVAGAQAEPARSGGAELAATGADGDLLGVTGIALISLGVGAVLLGMAVRRPRREAWHWG